MQNLELENFILECYPMLEEVRLHDFFYFKSEKRFFVHILVRNAEKDVEEGVKALLEIELGAETDVKITKAYCDEEYIRTRVSRFFAQNGGYLRPALSRLDYDVEKTGENGYKLAFYGGKNFCGYMDGALKESLLKYFHRCFLQEFEIETVEIAEERKHIEEGKTEIRAIEVTDRQMFVGKPCTERPGFIMDINGEYSEAVIAGKISGLIERTKKNPPKENARNKNPVYFTFTVTDPSGSFPCIMFPSIGNTPLIREELNGRECVLTGKIARDMYGELKMTVNSITTCTILTKEPPKDDRIKEEPIYYTNVLPEPLVVYEQSNVLEEKKVRDISKLVGKTIVTFDLETTGLDTSKDRIIEIGAAKLVDGEFTEKFKTFVNPKMHIPESATKVNNITDEMVKNAPAIEDVMADFYKFCYGATLCGHNVKDFDFRFLNNEAKRCGYIFVNPLIDTLELSVKYVRNVQNNKLGTLCTRFGVVNENAHRAYEDAISTARVLIGMLDEYKDIEI